MATNIPVSITATAAQNILLPMIRQLYPSLIAHQILSVQPMHYSASDIFSMKVNYNSDIAKFHKRYKFSRAKWYYCDFKYTDHEKVSVWCEEHFGLLSKGGDAWMRWKREGYLIRFRDEDDAIMFKLRWPA